MKATKKQAGKRSGRGGGAGGGAAPFVASTQAGCGGCTSAVAVSSAGVMVRCETCPNRDEMAARLSRAGGER